MNPPRDYNLITESLSRRFRTIENHEQRLQAVVDLLWENLHDKGVSWVGFYLIDSAGQQMLLGPRRDKPACSPIGLHGACGRAFLDNRPKVVHDVQELGRNYIACDPRDRSELVVPIHDSAGQPIGVLDLDSHEVGSFDESDAIGLQGILQSAGLHQPADKTRAFLG